MALGKRMSNAQMSAYKKKAKLVSSLSQSGQKVSSAYKKTHKWFHHNKSVGSKTNPCLLKSMQFHHNKSGQKVISGGSQKGAEIQRFFGDPYGTII